MRSRTRRIFKRKGGLQAVYATIATHCRAIVKFWGKHFAQAMSRKYTQADGYTSPKGSRVGKIVLVVLVSKTSRKEGKRDFK